MAAEWYYIGNKGLSGPWTIDELNKHKCDGKISDNMLVKRPDGKWVYSSDLLVKKGSNEQFAEVVSIEKKIEEETRKAINPDNATTKASTSEAVNDNKNQSSSEQSEVIVELRKQTALLNSMNNILLVFFIFFILIPIVFY